MLRELAAVLAGQGRPSGTGDSIDTGHPGNSGPPRSRSDDSVEGSIHAAFADTETTQDVPRQHSLGAVLALAAVGISYIALVETEDSDRLTSSGGEDSMEVLT